MALKIGTVDLTVPRRLGHERWSDGKVPPASLIGFPDNRFDWLIPHGRNNLCEAVARFVTAEVGFSTSHQAQGFPAMALAKLWNAFFGKSSSTEVPPPIVAEPKSTTPVISLTKTKSSDIVSKPVTKSAVPTSTPVFKLSRKKAKAGKQKAEKPIPVPVESSILPTVRMFKRKVNSWSKLIENRNITSILDLSIGDASRVVEILEAVVDATNAPPKVIAISLFELGASGTSVRQFHQRIRSAGGHPIAIPMALAEGLRRLSETVGTVDLVVIDGNEPDLVNPLVTKLLTRITSRDALVLKRDSTGRWQSNASSMPTRSRKAA